MRKKPNQAMIIAFVIFSCFVSSLVFAADKVVVIPLNSESAAGSGAKIAHITYRPPSTASPLNDCYAVAMPASGTVLSVQAFCTGGGGNQWYADVEKNGSNSVLTSRPRFLTGTVSQGTLKTDGTEDFAQGDVLTIDMDEDSESTNPTYPAVTIIVQYD